MQDKAQGLDVYVTLRLKLAALSMVDSLPCASLMLDLYFIFNSLDFFFLFPKI